MKQLKLIAFMSTAIFFSIATIAMAADMSGHEGHGKDMTQSTQEHDTGAMTQDQHKGELIRETTVEGYKFTYHLIDMREKIKEMKAAGHTHEMKTTHHLMVYITSPEGTPVTAAKVGYMIEGPGESSQKIMGMGMADGFGADVNYGTAGEYTVKCKVVAGETKLMDEFTYTAE